MSFADKIFKMLVRLTDYLPKILKPQTKNPLLRKKKLKKKTTQQNIYLSRKLKGSSPRPKRNRLDNVNHLRVSLHKFQSSVLEANMSECTCLCMRVTFLKANSFCNTIKMELKNCSQGWLIISK